MKKTGKIVALVLVLVVVAAAVGIGLQFRAKPILRPEGGYSCPQITLWLDGGNQERSGAKRSMLNDKQTAAVVEILGRYQKKLLPERLGEWAVKEKLVPLSFRGMEPDIPAWVEVSIFLENEQEFLNLLVGNGHVQQRAEFSYLPPYYEVLEEASCYQELSQAIGLAELLEKARG